MVISGPVDALSGEEEQALFFSQPIMGGWELQVLGFRSSEDDPADEMAYVFLASPQYRLLVDLDGDFASVNHVQMKLGGETLNSGDVLTAHS